MLLKQQCLKIDEYKSILITFNAFGSIVTSDYRCGTIFHMLIQAQTIIGSLAEQNQENCKKITPKYLQIDRDSSKRTSCNRGHYQAVGRRWYYQSKKKESG